jgi:hypothetical protein
VRYLQLLRISTEGERKNAYNNSQILFDEEMAGDPYSRILDRLNRLSQRLAEAERRLKILERSANPAGGVDGLCKPDPDFQNTRPVKHRYLERVIDEVRRRYKREHQI